MFYVNNIENQFTAQNLYMTYGGTNWGWQADPNVVYTSYDYGAAFSETRRLTEKVPVLKQLGALVATVKDLRKADDVGEQPSSNPAIRVWEKANPDTGARFFFVRHAGNGTAATDDTTTFAIGDHTVPVPRERARLQGARRRLRPGPRPARLLDVRDLRVRARGRAAARPRRRERRDGARLRAPPARAGAGGRRRRELGRRASCA